MNDLDTSAVVRGLLTYLDAAGVGQYTTTGQVFDGSSPALSEMTLPDHPDVAVAVALYDREISADPRSGGRVAMIQVRGRGAVNAPALDTSSLMDQVRSHLHGVHHATLGGVNVARVGFVYSALLGRDANGRQEQTDNYRVIFE